MVFDVESIGLHGEAFAVAWVVVDKKGNRLDEGLLSCCPSKAKGAFENREWVSNNVPDLKITSPTRQHMLNGFWHEWRKWADQGAVLFADCCWPVETTFLSDCIRLNEKEREWQGPYPLYDMSNILITMGKNPLDISERKTDELPAHHPLMDSRQSARILIECIGDA